MIYHSSSQPEVHGPPRVHRHIFTGTWLLYV